MGYKVFTTASHGRIVMTAIKMIHDLWYTIDRVDSITLEFLTRGNFVSLSKERKRKKGQSQEEAGGKDKMQYPSKLFSLVGA